MSGDGDGWVRCSLGHRHWGRFGAAGLLVNDGQRSVLQHRAPWTHEGGTWGLPGGARDSHEDPVTSALREAREEAAILEPSIAPVGYWIDDHGGWSYTTVVAGPRTQIRPHPANPESTDVRWWPDEQIAGLPLHQGFAASWPSLRTPPRPLVLVLVDVGAGQRAAAAVRSGITALARDGIAARDLPPGVDAGSLSRLLPRIIVTTALAPGADAAGWWTASIDSLTEGATVRQAQNAAVSIGAQTVVVTAEPHPPAPATIRAEPSWLLSVLRARSPL